ncbi:LLM class flavin-dependent oxidoreductase [Plantactinospora soyae]|uniref:Alkanesulfonate monooxygenase SsuD/methylene tetrahydromethanopterin reductase-like flavin-dependent oxidoreductase (Luciferase family) n=1 Tax=Plantactinospora soyae TaxID=1544732 RepID=A0A927R783_9ACTN|nr:LLM class flavin-dependent oxidoreductase [Plantactinospora soyae]MBE1487606.1 alkanesulfonate monooxygenase SsuD/methylene tetrahydromethanopterin reductase-like flavin-dependent oxidoreductase (luciferase family) [Plantactinospora soyae]
MGQMPIGVMYRCDTAPEQLPAYARLVERLGYDELWVVEDCFFGGAVSSAAVAAAVTDKLKIGIGILPAAFRNPALAAMELANLARLFPGRILPGFGHGMADWVRQVGADHPSPLAVLGETVEAVRALLAGNKVTVTGRYARLAEVLLEYPPDQPPPISTGVRGEKSLRLSGRVADGTILAEGASPEYVRWARGMIDEGRRAAGRTDDHRLTVYAHLDFDDARASARREFAAQLSGGWALPPSDADLADEIANLLAGSSGAAALAEALPEHYLDRFTAAGSAEQCAASVTRLWEASADAVVFVPPRDDQLAVAQITLASETLLPMLRAATNR